MRDVRRLIPVSPRPCPTHLTPWFQVGFGSVEELNGGRYCPWDGKEPDPYAPITPPFCPDCGGTIRHELCCPLWITSYAYFACSEKHCRARWKADPGWPGPYRTVLKMAEEEEQLGHPEMVRHFRLLADRIMKVMKGIANSRVGSYQVSDQLNWGKHGD